MNKLFRWLLLSSLTLPCAAQAQNVHEYFLDNGLKLVVKEDHRAPVVVSQVWYKVGSSYEPGGITGISHALEHMMFKGTPKYSQGKLSHIVAENGGLQNAMTSEDFTVYFQVFSKDKLGVSLDLESDRMKNLIISPAEFAKEIQVVMEERRLRTEDNPESLTYERFAAAAHVSSPYHHPVVGWMDDLIEMKADDLKAWYSSWYSPNNAVVVVVGDVVPDQVYQSVNEYFGKIPKGTVAQVKPQRPVAGLGKREVVVKAPAKLRYLVMGYNVPVISTAKEDWEPYALEVAANILDGGKSARFEKELVRQKQLVSSINVQYDPYSRLDGLFLLDARPNGNHSVEEVKKAVLSQVERLQNTLPSEEEFARVKAQVVASQIYKKDSVYGQAMEIGSLEVVGLSWKVGDAFADKVQAITKQQVQQVAKKYLTTDRLTIAELQPLPIAKGAVQPTGNLGGSNVH
jgi:zinc protease